MDKNSDELGPQQRYLEYHYARTYADDCDPYLGSGASVCHFKASPHPISAEAAAMAALDVASDVGRTDRFAACMFQQLHDLNRKLHEV